MWGYGHKYWPLYCLALVFFALAITFYCFIRYLRFGDPYYEFPFTRQCPICLENFSRLERIAESKVCNHVFHTRCLQAWLRTTPHPNCPVCRASSKSSPV